MNNKENDKKYHYEYKGSFQNQVRKAMIEIGDDFSLIDNKKNIKKEK